MPVDLSVCWSVRHRPPALTDRLHLWRISLDVGDDVLDRRRRLLDPDERARADRLRASRPSRRFAVARGTLRHLLSNYTGDDPQSLHFGYGEQGKPYLANPTSDLHFNVSHSGGVALMAFVTDREVGVDIERTQREVGWERVARRFFSDPELTQLMDLPAEQRRSGFFRCWTCKEAYMKATGRGITLGLANFGVCVDPNRPARLQWVQEGSVDDWWLLDVEPGEDAAGAVCVGGGRLPVERFEMATE